MPVSPISHLALEELKFLFAWILLMIRKSSEKRGERERERKRIRYESAIAL